MQTTLTELNGLLKSVDIKKVLTDLEAKGASENYKKADWHGGVTFFKNLKTRKASIQDMEERFFHYDFED